MFNPNHFETSNIAESGNFLEADYFNSVNSGEYKQKADNKINGEVERKEGMSSQEYAEAVMLRKQRALESSGDHYKKEDYINYKDSMKIAEECQPFDPENPTPFFASSLRKKILEKIDISEGDKLKFFTAVDSHLDHKHGVDAFFKLYNKNDKELSCATIDITGREKQGKADITMTMPKEQRDLYDPSSDEFDEKEFNIRLELEADRIIRKLENNNIINKTENSGQKRKRKVIWKN